MKKKMMVFLMVCVFVLSAIPVHAEQASFDVHVSADRNELSVGDTVHYTVTAKGEDVVALQFDVAVPEGMSYVPNSGATPKGLSDTLGVATAGWTEKTMRFSFYNDKGVSIPEGTVLMTFDCVVAAEGRHQVSLVGVAPYDSEFVGIEPTMQFATVTVGDVSGEGETQVHPNPPETETSVPDSETETAPGEETIPGISEGDGTSSETMSGSDSGNSGSTSSGNDSGSSEGSAGAPSGNDSGSSESSPDASSGNDSGSSEGSPGAPSGNDGSSSEGSTDVPSDGGNVSSGGSDSTSSSDSSTSSSEGVTSSGDGSGEVQNPPQAPDTAVSNPQDGTPEQGTEPAETAPAQQPGQDTVVSAEDTLAQQPESDTTPQKSEEETASGGESASNPTSEETGSEPDTQAAENGEETVSPEHQDTDDKDEKAQPVWLWPTLAVTGVLLLAAVIFLIVKKKR